MKSSAAVLSFTIGSATASNIHSFDTDSYVRPLLPRIKLTLLYRTQRLPVIHQYPPILQRQGNHAGSPVVVVVTATSVATEVVTAQVPPVVVVTAKASQIVVTETNTIPVVVTVGADGMTPLLYSIPRL